MDSAWQQRYGASGCGEASGAVEGGGGGGGDRDSSAERGGSMLGWETRAAARLYRLW